MTPANAIVVERAVTADEDELLDELTDYALQNGLEVRRQHEGSGMLLVPRRDAQVEGEQLFRSGDSLQVVISPDDAGSVVVLTAKMDGLHRRGDEWKQGRMIRGGIFSALFVVLGVAGLTHGVGVGDFVLLGIGASSASRMVLSVRNESNDREEFEHRVANSLHALCDRLVELD